ncbi:Gfo/Idh/MocA family protein [Ekhidna sp.]|uniref:Gfo/Idh/MocA family protein n=1 Tax=Ekhidna sp. TaxID=2608089 RepID=UPI003B58C40B
MKTDSLGIAIVGLGYYSTYHIAPAITKSNKCHLAAVVTGSNIKGTMWRHKYNLKKESIYSYESFTDIGSNDEIDIVYIALPISLHAKYTVLAASVGKHVICEKPMAANVGEAKAMIRACKSNNVKLAIGYRLHYEPHHQFLMQLKSRNQILEIKSEFGHPIADKNEWRLSKNLAGGGALLDSGIYCIQAARYITSELPKSVRAVAEYSLSDDGVEDWIDFEFLYENRPNVKFNANYREKVNKLVVKTSNHKYVLNKAFGFKGQKFRNPLTELRIPKTRKAPIVSFLEDFIDYIENDTNLKASGYEGLIDVQIIEALYKSARTKREEPVIYLDD